MIRLPPETSLELMTEKEGWWYRKYALGDTGLEGLETEAREARRGLWVEPNSISRWEWR